MENWKEEHKKIFTITAVVLAVFLAVLTVSEVIDIQNRLGETDNVLSVSGKGTVYAKPDLVLTTFSVVTESKTVSEGLAENANKMNAVINSTKSQGVEERDLKTTSFNIYPRYEYYDRNSFPPYPQGTRVLVGYQIQQSLQTKIRDLSKIGQIIEGATAAGANQVGDLQFTVDEQDELKAQARKEAIEEAKAKAKELAKQLGVRLVRVSSFNESSATPRFYGLEDAAAGIGGGIQIEAGENKIEVSVTITYAIK